MKRTFGGPIAVLAEACMLLLSMTIAGFADNGATTMVTSMPVHASSAGTTDSQFQGIFTHTEPASSMDDQLKSMTSVLNENPYISGITIKLLWQNFHPQKNTVNMDNLEAMISLAASKGKLVHLALTAGLHSPDWVYQEGAIKAGPVSAGTQSGFTTLPWDPKFMQLYAADVKLIADKYAADPRVTAVIVQGPTYHSTEMHAPSAASLKAYGYSDQKSLDNWKYWIDLYKHDFPQKHLIIVVSQMYGKPASPDLASEVANYFVDQCPGLAILETNQLSGRQDEAEQLSHHILSQLSSKAPTGHEMVGSFKEQPERQGTPEETIYNFVSAGNPLFLQMWRRDCDDPKYAKLLLDAWNKYGQMRPEDIKADLIKQGIFVEKNNYKLK